ncbi:MAG: tRNA uridine-5-carboxymethylaminomethyl(34) synthesis GTPase MnmE, partial [Prevotella sp.]|nr:tRNA uridine-5-carboxymethylaminomethyl(34) synthesis GTPase MnmE [Prevotella sp.]
MTSEILNNDTICALATPAGGAIAIIRISGSETFPILLRIFKSQSANSETIGQLPTRSLHYGNIVFPSDDSDEQTSSQIIDEVLVSIFKHPHSYTGEDSAEISCHGSSYIITKILEALIANGCRMANPGEYTMRAYLNGKMDLSQAEAVADLIASTNKATHQIAMSQLRGHFSSELYSLREQLLRHTSMLELEQ